MSSVTAATAKKTLTLCLLRQGDRLLLGMKKRGFGTGRWNGFGGKVEKGESIERAARREMREEAGVEVRDLEQVGLLDFAFRGDPTELEVHVFRTAECEGQPAETEEMRPQWFDVGALPYAEMWPDDRYWMPMFLEGKKFRCTFLYDGSDTILAQSLLETDTLDP